MPQRRQNSMVRIFTSFIFGVTIVPSPCSISVQAMPRQPSSPASASPTGPPPTIRTGVFFILSRTSIVLHACGLADHDPFLVLDGDVGSELLRRVRLPFGADISNQILNIGRLHAFIQRLI